MTPLHSLVPVELERTGVDLRAESRSTQAAVTHTEECTSNPLPMHFEAGLFLFTQ